LSNYVFKEVKVCGRKTIMIRKIRLPQQFTDTMKHTPLGHAHTRSHRYRRNSKLTTTSSAITIVGAGPAGLATALSLSKSLSFSDISILEKAPSLPDRGTALGLWTNAWKALDALGIGNDLRAVHPKLDKVVLCRDNGKILRQFSMATDCHGGPHEFRGVSRAHLNKLLADKLPPGIIKYNTSVESVQLIQNSDGGGGGGGIKNTKRGSIQLQLSTGELMYSDAVIGCDGSKSATVAATDRSPPNYAGQVAIRGVAKLQPGNSCSAAMLEPCVRQIWGQGVRAGSYPISDDELYFFVCFNRTAAQEEEEDERSNASGSVGPKDQNALAVEALKYVGGWKWGIPEAVQVSAEQNTLTRSRIVDRWDFILPSQSGGITLAGDALHPMTPNLGQGGCTALEDAVVLARVLKSCGLTSESAIRKDVASLHQAFRIYERQRAKRTLPLTVRAHAMGFALQMDSAPVCFARDLFVEKAFSPAHFLDHTEFDCTSRLV
jgi:2-polyprenyl-6-methoxyphenol hydroxylase-like FAD-dependent oxidoreductase